MKSLAILAVSAVCLLSGVRANAAESRIVIRGGIYWGQVVVEESAKVLAWQWGEKHARMRFNVSRGDDVRHVEKFCDGECDVLYHRAFPSDEEAVLLASRFSSTAGRAETFLVGYAQVAVIVNQENAVRQLTLDQIRDLLWMKGEGRPWPEFGGSGGVVQCFGEDRDSTSRAVIRHACMMLGPDKPTGYYLYREDFEHCSGVDEVVERVRANRNGIGFILYHGQPLRGVKVLPIAKNEDGQAVNTAKSQLIQGNYPLSESLVLYLRPDAPPEAREFCEFATGPEGAKIAKKFGLWPEYELAKERGQQRLAEVKAGKGRRSWSVIWLAGKICSKTCRWNSLRPRRSCN